MRTKQYQIPETSPDVVYDSNQEPIVLSKHLIDVLLTQENPSDCIGLYCFYYYTAKWQKTNQPKATTQYVAKGIKWGIDKVQKIKAVLKDIGLIEDITVRNENNSITGHYIKVNFIWSNTKSHVRYFTSPGEMPPLADCHPWQNKGSNTLSSDKGNSLSKNKENSREKDISVPLANFLQKIIEEKKNIRHTPMQIEKWARDIFKLIKTNQVSYERIRTALRWYKDHCRDEYCPVIESGASLREKFLKLEAAMEREQNPRQPKEQPHPNTIGYREPNKKYREADRHA